MNTTDTTTITVTRNGQDVTFEHVTGLAWDGQPDLRQVTPFKSQSGKTHTLRTFLMEGVEIDAATPGLARQALEAARELQAQRLPAMTADEALGDDLEAEEPTLTVEMWTVYPDGTPGDTYVMNFPARMRRHDMLRKMAGYALARPDARNVWVRVPRRFIRVNSVQGVAWDTRDVSRVAYSRIVEA